MKNTENTLEKVTKTLGVASVPEVPVSTPMVDPEEVSALRGMVATMRKELDTMKVQKPPSGATVRNRTKIHEAPLREYAEGDTILGIVVKLYNVKEVKDKEENKRFIGTCTLDVVNPITKKETTIKDVDYLAFLNDGKRVIAKILNWKKEVRYEVDIKKGGGGRGPLKHQNVNNEVVVDMDYEFEVGYVDHSFTLQITEGQFEGAVMETNELALNI